MKAISYALFGYNKERQANCFDFNSYLRGLLINIRMNRLLYPGWDIVLQTDQSTYDAFEPLFNSIGIRVQINKPAPLCMAMLWRLKPVFENGEINWKYTHVICRDLDSPATYREAQAVQHWINNDKAMHAITDSVSHCLALLGGMIGMRPHYFTERVAQTWEGMIAQASGIDFSIKGSDQTFLNQYIYPQFAKPGCDSITQHYCLGYGNTFLSDYHDHIPDIELPNVDPVLKATNDVCGHIGAAGYYETAMFKFLHEVWDQFPDLLAAEKNYPKIFYWTI